MPKRHFVLIYAGKEGKEYQKHRCNLLPLRTFYLNFVLSPRNINNLKFICTTKQIHISEASYSLYAVERLSFS